MRLGIDATGIYEEKTGMEHYLVNFVNNILAIDSQNDYFIYCKRQHRDEFFLTNQNATLRTFNFKNRKIFQQTRLPHAAKADNLDFIFFPASTASIFPPCKALVTIHDIFPFVIPDHSPTYHRLSILSDVNFYYWKYVMERACHVSERIITVSQSTKNDIQRFFSLPSNKIEVIYPGVSQEFETVNDASRLGQFRIKYGLPKPYILCAGTSPQKNLKGSIRAFELIRQRGFDLQLVIIGNKAVIGTSDQQIIDECRVKKDLVFTGYFPQADLTLLYNSAELLLFPSFYEGFGLPVLEAFACGIPVITSRLSSLPEVAGEAAILVDPFDHQQIALHMEQILSNSCLKRALVDKGLKQVKNFNWLGSARRFVSLLRHLDGGSARE